MPLKQKIIHDLQGEPIKAPHMIFGHAVYLSIHPGRLILFPFRKWFEKKYLGRYKFERALFLFDVFLIGCIFSLAVTLLFFILFPLKQFRDNITFIATVAPHEVISGAPSTLVIDYQNKTKEILKDPKLDLTFPKHFLLQSISYNGTNVSDKNISLSDIPVGGTGTIHIQGVMFGDVGGEQIFGSTLTFTHGKKKEVTEHTSELYSFSPSHSTLTLDLTLPDRAIASQSMSGIITYKNTSAFDFPEVIIKPEWPTGFTFLDASTQIRNESFILTNVKAGTNGEIQFKGKLGDVPNTLPFIFHPSFVFGQDRYSQETLTQSVPILPAQIQLSTTIEKNILTPGTDAVFHIHYKHIGDEPLQKVKIGITSRSPFFSTQNSFGQTILTLNPGDEGTIDLTIPIRPSVETSALTSYQNILVRSNTTVSYTRKSVPNETLITSGTELETPLTTPLNIESFARYTTPEGDQIGRGSLPPRVGQKTSYWIFWHIDGTSNQINNGLIEGTLLDNVSFSGHQTSSEDNGVTFNEATHKVSWNVASIPPTLDPQAQVFSSAFEVIVIPSSNQIGSTATLMKNIHFSGTDAFTGSLLNKTSIDITTSLPNDKMAKNKGVVK